MKVEQLYMTQPDMLRSGHRVACDSLECDPDGIIGDVNHGIPDKNLLLAVSTQSYDIIDASDIVLDRGILMENILVDFDIDALKPGTIIEIDDVLFEIIRPCKAFAYLYGFAPELPELLEHKRGMFLRPLEEGQICIGSTVRIVQTPNE